MVGAPTFPQHFEGSRPMPFKAANAFFVSFAIEVLLSGVSQVMIVETDLHLDARDPSYDPQALADSWRKG